MQNLDSEEVACSPYCDGGQGFPGVCQILPSVPEGVCITCMPIVQIGQGANVGKRNKLVQWTEQYQDPLIKSRTSAALPLSWPLQTLSSLSSSTPMPVGLAWAWSSIRPLMEKNM